MPTITIQGTVIDFPESSASPNWSQGIIDFAKAVEEALSGAVGQYDVAPQVFNGDSYNPGSNIDLPSLAFPTTSVRSAVINYSVYRTTSTSNAAEAGILNIVYNPNNGVGLRWEMTREFVGDGQIAFNITDLGQIQFSTTALGGISHYMRIGYSAKALEQT